MKSVGIIVAVCILAMLLLEAGIQINGNLKMAARTTDILLDQIIQTAQKNENADKSMEASLKEEYIIRAKSVAYVVEKIPGIEHDLWELKRIADMLSVDEIHLFNLDGVIYGGSVPLYYGIGMDDGEQIGYFKPMLTGDIEAMCQDVTPNTAEGKSMMYAMVWREDHSGLVQVGIEPVRLLEEMRNHEMSQYIDSIPAVEESIFAVDAGTGIICGATKADLIGKTLEEIGVKTADRKLGKICMEKIENDYNLCEFAEHNGYLIGVAYSVSMANKSLPNTLLIMFIYLLGAAGVIFFVIRRMRIIDSEKSSLRKTSNTDELTGLFNRRAYENDAKQYRDGRIPKDLLLISMDINSLKAANDALGHSAGDELIIGAASCMRASFERYGKIYRTGGDEFIAILFLPGEKVPELIRDFDRRTGAWRGKLVDSLNISCGCLSGSQAQFMSFGDMETAVDAKMYEAKRKYYESAGHDRRNRNP